MRNLVLPALFLLSASAARAQCVSPHLRYDRRYDFEAYDMTLGVQSVAAVGDLDGRSGLDVVFAVVDIASWPVQVFLNNGAGSFVRSLHPPLPSGTTATGAALGDIDRDGDLDLIVVRLGPSAPLFLMNDGQGRFTVEPLGSRIGDMMRANAVSCADFDRDGWNDLFFGMERDGHARLYLNDRRGGFVEVSTTHLMGVQPGCVQNAEAADVDGDSDIDLVLAMGGWRGARQENMVLINDGRGVLSAFILAGIRRWSQGLAIGDLNGDGLPELVFGAGQDPPELWINLGGGTFADGSPSLPQGASNTMSVAILDIDGDGRNDIAAGVARDGAFRIEAYMNRAGQGYVLDPMAIDPVAVQGFYLHPADTDRDGDLDLVVGGHTAPYGTHLGLKVFLQRRRQILPSIGPQIGRRWDIALWARPGQLVLPALSFGSTETPLGALGILGLDPVTMFSWGPFDMGTQCLRTTTVTIPDMPSLRDRRIHAQAWVVDFAQPTETRLTTWTTDTFRPRP